MNFKKFVLLLGQEDCLYINVYAPANFANTTEQFHVIVIFHGGAFMGGSGHNGLKTFLDKDMVLVSFNYRLGILGKHLPVSSKCRPRF